VPVDNTPGVLAAQCQGEEFVMEADGCQPQLPVVIVDVQQAGVRSRIGRRFGLVNGHDLQPGLICPQCLPFNAAIAASGRHGHLDLAEPDHVACKGWRGKRSWSS
jgi:hypothetical protein